jgi:hypothetical protein
MAIVLLLVCGAGSQRETAVVEPDESIGTATAHATADSYTKME